MDKQLPSDRGEAVRIPIVQQFTTGCPFCTVPGFNLPLRETFGHLFFECPATKIVYEQFKARYWNEVDSNGFKKMIFLGLKDGKKISRSDHIPLLLLLFAIWKARRHKKISYATVENSLVFYYHGLMKSCRKLQIETVRNVSLWCRTWGRDGDRDWGDLRHGHG